MTGVWAETFSFVIPAKAGIHIPQAVGLLPHAHWLMDSRLRRNDGVSGLRAVLLPPEIPAFAGMTDSGRTFPMAWGKHV